jgi:peptide/nickel transport system permease protein
MSKLVWRRLALGLLTLWLISLVVFAAMLALPGDAATAILGKEATPDRVAALRDQLHLEDSVVTQYLKWLEGVLTGSFGTSVATQQPVSELLSDRVGNSAFLVLVASLVAIPLSIALGVWMAMRRDRPVDHVTSTVTLVLAVTPYISRIMRGSMVEVLESEYVTMARLKGLSERTVIWRHAVPNAIVPAIQVAALQLAWMAGGIVVVEFVFSYPGIGAALIDAVGNRDMPVVQTVTILAAAIYVVMNLIADLATILVTPKLRTAAR